MCTLLRRDSPRRQPTRTPEEPYVYSYRARGLRKLGMHDKGQPLELLRREAGMRWHAVRALGGMWNTLMTLTGRHAVHCHSVVNVWGDVFRAEWQCSPHCQTASSVPYRYDQGRVAVRPVRLRASGSATHTATRR